MFATPRLSISRCLRFVMVSWLLLPLFLISAAAQTQQPIFPLDNFTSPGGVLVSPLATGDFNGDGQPDIAYLWVPSAGAPPPTLTVLLSQGASNPPIAVTTTSLTGCSFSSYSYSLVAADMNKDNRLDVLLTCPNGYVAELMGNGDGTFQSPTYFAVPAPISLAVPVDLNGDGFPDVAVSTFLNNTSGLAVLLNQGSAAPGKLSNGVAYGGPTGIRTSSCNTTRPRTST